MSPRLSGRRQGAGVSDFTFPDGADLGSLHRHNRRRLPIQGGELDFVGKAIKPSGLG
jgi:hypothetical protein